MAATSIEHILAQDLSVGTDAFREDLLQRCLSVFDQADSQGFELDDNEIDMLAAAGIPDLARDPDGLV